MHNNKEASSQNGDFTTKVSDTWIGDSASNQGTEIRRQEEPAVLGGLISTRDNNSKLDFSRLHSGTELNNSQLSSGAASRENQGDLYHDPSNAINDLKSSVHLKLSNDAIHRVTEMSSERHAVYNSRSFHLPDNSSNAVAQGPPPAVTRSASLVMSNTEQEKFYPFTASTATKEPNATQAQGSYPKNSAASLQGKHKSSLAAQSACDTGQNDTTKVNNSSAVEHVSNNIKDSGNNPPTAGHHSNSNAEEDRRVIAKDNNGLLPEEYHAEAEYDLHEKQEWIERDVQALR